MVISNISYKLPRKTRWKNDNSRISMQNIKQRITYKQLHTRITYKQWCLQKVTQ